MNLIGSACRRCFTSWRAVFVVADTLGSVDFVDALIAVVTMKPPEFAAKKCLKIWFLTLHLAAGSTRTSCEENFCISTTKNVKY
jgi:hypothetical protein